MLLTLECLPGVGILPQLLRLGVEDPGLVDAAGMEVGVQEDAVKGPPQLIFLPKDPVKLRRPESLGDRGPRLHPKI